MHLLAWAMSYQQCAIEDLVCVYTYIPRITKCNSSSIKGIPSKVNFKFVINFT